jgi:ketosteroid isomerase-like protein
VGKGHQGVNEFWDAYNHAFPDNHVAVATTVGDRSQVAVEESWLEGTHTGEWGSAEGAVPPSGNRIRVPFVGLHTERAGRLVSSRFYYDQLDFLSQLGALPSAAQ